MKQIALTATVLTAAEAASAQSNVTMRGNIDQYVNDMTSSSGAKVKSLKDGACLRSHVGRRGTEDLGDGLQAKFQLEGGLSTDTGRFFDRQSWVGIADQYGEARVGRQNGPMFAHGGNIDDTTRTLGSTINNFGVPSRYDSNGGFRPGGSAGLKTSFTNPADINGRTINGVQFGIVHRF
jgi:predicted porin